MRRLCLKAVWCGVLVAVILTGCRGRSTDGRLIVLGLDGLDPRAVDLLMSEGKMPHFARLRQEGSYGHLLAAKPMLSPVLWTTIATGKEPHRHGIGHFVATSDATGDVLPVTSEMRRVKALWNMLSESGKKVAVVGWWATWPAEDVNGVIVSDHTCYHFLFRDGVTGSREHKGITHPPELLERLSPYIRRPGDVTKEEAAPFVDVPDDVFSRPFEFNDDVSHFKWALATADSYRSIGLDLWKKEQPDLLMVYIEGTDTVSHLFGHLFRTGDLSGPLAVQKERFGEAVEQMYVYADRLVGAYMDVMDDDTTLIVASDHGFELGALQDDPSKTHDMRRVSERFHREEGILYMYGRGVRQNRRIQQPRQVDIAPTLLALTGLAPAADMPGRVLEEALKLEVVPARVATYEQASSESPTVGSGSSVDADILARLEALGYIGGTSSPQGDNNLAALHFEAGRYEDALREYARLVEEQPEDASLRTSLAGVLGTLGRYGEAAEQLETALELDPLNVEAYHNLAVIFERRGDRVAAIENYRTALRYSPQYEPSRQALSRLTGSAELRAPRGEAEARAAKLAATASEVARRGDYEQAMQLLREAEVIAPKYVLIYQYQSNVAYLMGNYGSSARALIKALEIEPDNALFQANLDRVQKQAQESRK